MTVKRIIVSHARKRNYSDVTLEEAMGFIHRQDFIPWNIPAPSRPPSNFLQENLRRLEVFDLVTSEQAKTLLIDALFAEIVPHYAGLKIWKMAALKTDKLTGVADYLVTPRRAYISTPFLCVTEAKRDDFERGRAQCVAEMFACQWHNHQKSLIIDVFGIVSNGQGWQFYKLDKAGDIYQSELYGLRELPVLLGTLDYVCGECAQNLLEDSPPSSNASQ